MPVILTENDFEMWLDPEFEDADQLVGALKPYPDQEMEFYGVSTNVNKASFEDPSGIERMEQKSLFD